MGFVFLMIQRLLVQTSSGICVAHDPEAFSSRTQWTIYLSSIGIWPNIGCWSGTRGFGPSTQWDLCWSSSRAFHPSTQWAFYLCIIGIWPKFAVGQEPEGLVQVGLMLESLVQVLSGIYVGLDPEPFIQVPSGLPIFVALGCDQILLLVRNQSLWSKHPMGFVFF